MLQIKRITPPTATIVHEDGTVIGEVNEYELGEFRCQIKRLNHGTEAGEDSDYRIHWKEHVIKISSRGLIERWPKGFFDHFEQYLDELFSDD